MDLLTNENIKKEVFKVKKLQKNKYQLTAGPYSSLNTLKKIHTPRTLIWTSRLFNLPEYISYMKFFIKIKF